MNQSRFIAHIHCIHLGNECDEYGGYAGMSPDLLIGSGELAACAHLANSLRSNMSLGAVPVPTPS